MDATDPPSDHKGESEPQPESPQPVSAREGEQPARPARFWFSLAVVSALVFVYVWLVNTPTNELRGTEDPVVGRRLGYLQLEPLTGDGTKVTLENLSGRVTVINYWGTWCPPCLREFPQIATLFEKFHAESDFRLYAVSCGEEHDPELDELREQTKAFLKSRQSSLPTYSDQNATSRHAMAVLLGMGSLGYPTTLVIDRQGVIRGFWQGYDRRAGSEMAALVEQLLAEPPLEVVRR